MRSIAGYSLLSLIFLAPIGVLGQITESGPTYGTYPVNAASLPALNAASAKATDPSFNTPIMRLTDGADGNTSCTIAYSYWPVFNKDSTRIAVLCAYPTARTAFFQLNSDTFTVSNRQVVPYLSGDMIWSAVDPDLVFTRSGQGGGGWYGPVLNSYNVATGVTTVLKDFTSSILPTGYGLNQMSRSMDDDVWAFTVVDAGGHFYGYLVWRKSTDQVLLNQPNSGSNVVDEVQIDKSGRYLNVQNTNGNTEVWDVQTSSLVQLTWGLDGYVHEDTGHGNLLSVCGGNSNIMGICFRRLRSPHTQPTILPGLDSTQTNAHFSMLADNEGWGLVTNENPNLSVTLPFHGEIYQVATNGSGRVRRLVHHNSTAVSYEHNAFGNVSRDGRFIAWTSDWGNASGRTDVYIAQIPPAAQIPPPISGPTPALDVSTAYSDGGYAYMIQSAFGTPADNSNYLNQSMLRLFENGLELGPPHSPHADIRSYGLGRFSHWAATDGTGEALRFSTSDNTDPHANGRNYFYNVPDTRIPLDVTGARTDGGYAFIIYGTFGNNADTATYPTQSTFRLFENGVELAPAHSAHADIRSYGLGRFSHWSAPDGTGEAIRFSSSDNTDPSKNGRSYSYIIDTRLP